VNILTALQALQSLNDEAIEGWRNDLEKWLQCKQGLAKAKREIRAWKLAKRMHCPPTPFNYGMQPDPPQCNKRDCVNDCWQVYIDKGAPGLEKLEEEHKEAK
jgi:hypothetical protein